MNRIIISGRIGQKPELKTSQNGFEYTNFSVAVNRKKRKDDTEIITDWFNCSAFGKTAAFIEKYFDKGDGIEVEGRMESSKKDDKTYWSLTVEQVEFPKGKKNSEPSNVIPMSNTAPEGFTPDDDIPF